MWFLSRFVHILQCTLTRSSRFCTGFLILHLLHTSHYNICSPASLRLRLPIHILSIVPFTSFSGSNIYPLRAPGHQAIRLCLRVLHFVAVLSWCPLSSTTPTFTACSTTVCDALPCGRLIAIYDSYTANTAMPQAYHTHATRKARCNTSGV